MGRCRRSRRRGWMRPVLPIHGEVSAQPTEGLDETCPPHSWGGVGAADGGADLKAGRSHTRGSVLRSFHCTRFAQNGPNFPLETRVLRKTLQNREVPR